MKKYSVKKTFYQTYVIEVMATSEDVALEKAIDGDGDVVFNEQADFDYEIIK